jgi:glycosyltransferase involved in cell wall biosynthesis
MLSNKASLNNPNPIISICIPTYNGERTIINTLNELETQINNSFEIIVSDDSSTDNTLNLVKNFQNKCQYLKVFNNEENIGMDRNFYKTTQYAIGKYIWFCGQDDLLCNDILKNVLDMVNKYPNIGILNLNFSQYDHNMELCLTTSFFDDYSYQEKNVKNPNEIFFDSPNDYFKYFTQPPSFLPSVVMLKSYWLDTDVKQFYGTFFIQVGVLLLNMHKNNIGVITTPHIKGRVPDDQWQADGNKLFSILTGDLVAKSIAFKANKSLPDNIIKRDKLRYLANYFFLLYNSKKTGFIPNQNNKKQLKLIFSDKLLYNLFLAPLLCCNLRILSIMHFPLFLVKRLLLSFRIFSRLR